MLVASSQFLFLVSKLLLRLWVEVVTNAHEAIHRAPVFDYGQADNAPEVLDATKFWNDKINEEHRKFRVQHPLARSEVVDPAASFNQILDNPNENGAPNSTCTSFPEGTPCLWHDFIHPGIVIQQRVGEQIGRRARKMRFLP